MANINYLTTNSSYKLSHSELGKSKPCLRTLPGEEFTYGKSTGEDKYGAKDLISDWQFHQPSKEIAPARDLKKLNKFSIKNGQFTSKDFSQFRKSHIANLKVHKGRNSVPYMLPEDGFTYGVANRPPTPIYSVLSHEYATQSEMMAKDIYKARYIDESKQTTLFPKITRSVELNKNVTQKKVQEFQAINQPKELFKMSKFKNVPFKVDTINQRYLNMRSTNSNSLQAFHSLKDFNYSNKDFSNYDNNDNNNNNN